VKVVNPKRFILAWLALVSVPAAGSSYSYCSIDPLEGATEIEPRFDTEWVTTARHDLGFERYRRPGPLVDWQSLRESSLGMLSEQISAAGYVVAERGSSGDRRRDEPANAIDSNYAHRFLSVRVRGEALEHDKLEADLHRLEVETSLCVDFWKSDPTTGREVHEGPRAADSAFRYADRSESLCADVADGEHFVEPFHRRASVVVEIDEIEDAVLELVTESSEALFSIVEKCSLERTSRRKTWVSEDGRYEVELSPAGAGDLYRYLRGSTLVGPFFVSVYAMPRAEDSAPISRFPLSRRDRPQKILVSPDASVLALIYHAVEWTRLGPLVQIWRATGERVAYLNGKEILDSFSRPHWRSEACRREIGHAWQDGGQSITADGEYLALAIPDCPGAVGAELQTREARVRLDDGALVAYEGDPIPLELPNSRHEEILWHLAKRAQMQQEPAPVALAELAPFGLSGGMSLDEVSVAVGGELVRSGHGGRYVTTSPPDSRPEFVRYELAISTTTGLCRVRAVRKGTIETQPTGTDARMALTDYALKLSTAFGPGNYVGGARRGAERGHDRFMSNLVEGRTTDFYRWDLPADNPHGVTRVESHLRATEVAQAYLTLDYIFSTSALRGLCGPY